MKLNTIRAIILFYVIAYGITWLLWLPYYLPVFPGQLRRSPVFHFVGSFGPMIAALVCVALQQDKAGVKKFLTGVFDIKTRAWPLFAFVTPFIILFVSVSLMTQGRLSLFDWQNIWLVKELHRSGPVLWLLVNVGIYGLGEETGWRGFALPALEARFHPFVAALLISALWAIWHWPLFFYVHSGYYNMDFYDMLGWLFSIVTGSVILSWIYNGSKGSILACALFHGAMEVAFVSGKHAAQVAQYSGAIITCIGLLIILITKGRLGYSARK